MDRARVVVTFDLSVRQNQTMDTPSKALSLDATHAEIAKLQAETLAIQAETALLRAQTEAMRQAMQSSILERPWFSWFVAPAAGLAGMGLVIAIAIG
jgi:hypothetical protein